MEASGTEALRSSATHWSLAGDKKLLELLQEIHIKVVTRCKETNALLEQMATSLDEASVDVQSVNNKFMSLSNSQFVESRIYGDDDDVTTDPIPQKEDPIPPDSPLTRTKQSLQVLERMHEAVEIYDDTDSESESDDCVSSTVLKPKDVYSHRPLPYVIGSQNWRNKWHVGLIHESSESDSDSDVEKRLPKSEYSDTESEREEPKERSRTLSSSPSPLQSEVGPRNPPQIQTPADIASELARRLGNVAQSPITTDDMEPPKLSTGKIYRPDQPTTSTLFSDEPPPLDDSISEIANIYEDEVENDIFAELHSNRAKEPAREEQRQNNSQPIIKQKPTLFEDDSEPELFAPKTQKPEQRKKDETDNSVKKPIGGISLFGNNKGAESIGAAILKRNKNKSSSSDEDSDSKEVTEPNIKPTIETNKIESENNVQTQDKDIFANLFSKPQKTKTTTVRKEKQETEIVKPEQKKKVDLFSDDLFDDIDDIFSSNIVKNVPKSNEPKPKSLFDDDEDLFAEVATSKPVKCDSNDSGSKKKSIFDSEDELFSEKPKDTSENPEQDDNKSNSTQKKSIFDSEDELFFDRPKENTTKVENKVSVVKKKGLFDSDEEFSDSESKSNYKQDVFSKSTDTKQSNVSFGKKSKTKSIFDDSSDEDNVFDKVIVSEPIRETAIISDHTHISKDKEQYNKINGKIGTNISKEINAQNNNDQILSITSDITDNDTFNNNFNNNSSYLITPNQLTNINKEYENKTKNEAFQSPSLFDDEDDNLFFKSSSKNLENKLDNKKENTVPSNNEALNITKEEKSIDFKSPLPTEDIKCTSHVLDAEIPYKIIGKKLKEPGSVNDSWHEDNFVSEANDLDNNKLISSTEEHTSVETECALFANDMKDAYKSENTEVLGSLPPTRNEKLETENYFENKLSQSEFTKSSITEPINQNPLVLDKPQENKENNITFEENKTVDLLKSALSPKTDVFDELFTDEPPAFEKPKEPKKSKNINALFDDDSDDEALFFKKSDAPLVDEKTELFSTSPVKSNLFGIFQDEPPDLNVDFIQKDDKPIKSNVDKPLVKEETLPKALPNLEQAKQENDIIQESKKKPEVKEFKKPIGKIKSNLNINVSTLLPRASPKKTIKIKEPSETVQSTNTSTEELDSKSSHSKSENNEPPTMKRSVSFEDTPDANVLDNNLSKQRAKIQVKRRPSSRKARHEAARRSVHLNDDSTDHSSSIDDYSAPVVKNKNESQIVDPTLIVSDDNITKNVGILSKEEIFTDIEPQVTKSVISTGNKDVKSKVVYILNDEDIFTNTDTKSIESNLPSNFKSNNTKTSQTSDPLDLSLNKDTVDFKDSDDFLNLLAPKKQEKNTTPTDDKQIKQGQNIKPILDIIHDDDDLLFKQNLAPKVEIKVNENTKTETEKPKTSLFDDLSDEEYDLFKPNASKITKPNTMFGSDSDDSIFVSIKKEMPDKHVMVEKRDKVDVKKSLFSDDDDDDDDLFGARKSSVDIKEHSSSTNLKKENKETKRSKIALEDPLSMADEDF